VVALEKGRHGPSEIMRVVKQCKLVACVA